MARIFEKKHHHVLNAIRNPIIPDYFSATNFSYVEILEENVSNLMINKSYFKLTRDGFNLIALGFTGRRAMQHKIEFIYAFNVLEGELERLRLSGPPAPPQIEETFWYARCRKTPPQGRL